jgi:hypothetical protein
MMTTVIIVALLLMVVIKDICWVEPMHQTSQTEVDSTMPATDETRKILPIFLVVLIDVLGLMIILPLLPFYAERFGATPFVVGMLVSSYALCQFFSGPLLGRWSDHVGRKPLLIVSQVGTCLGFLLLAFANSLPLIFLSRIIDGLTAGNLPLAQAYISDVTRPENRAAAFGKILMAFGIGFPGPEPHGLSLPVRPQGADPRRGFPFFLQHRLHRHAASGRQSRGRRADRSPGPPERPPRVRYLS